MYKYAATYGEYGDVSFKVLCIKFYFSILGSYNVKNTCTNSFEVSVGGLFRDTVSVPIRKTLFFQWPLKFHRPSFQTYILGITVYLFSTWTCLKNLPIILFVPASGHKTNEIVVMCCCINNLFVGFCFFFSIKNISLLASRSRQMFTVHWFLKHLSVVFSVADFEASYASFWIKKYFDDCFPYDLKLFFHPNMMCQISCLKG